MPTLRQSLVATVLRRYPFYSGAGTLANSALVTKLAGQSDESVWCRTPGGDVLASLSDYVGRAAFYCGDLDPKICWVVRNLVVPGDIALDIGANIGVVTLLLSKLVGEAGKVHAFEPNPSVYQSLTAALARNRASNVQAHAIALGSTSEERELAFPEHNAGAGSLCRPADHAQHRALNVHVRTLDNIISRSGIDRIEFIKLDVEGFEGEVLKGSTKTMESLRPNAIVFEMNEPAGTPLAELPVFKILMDFDYAFLYVPKRFLAVRPIAFDPRTVAEIPGHDVIAVPKGNSFEHAVRRLNAHV